MISPHTPPGTKVVFLRTPRGDMSNEPSGEYKAGDIVTIAEIFPNRWAENGFAANLVEGNRLPQCLSLFRRLDLPESLTSLLNVKPIDVPQSSPVSASPARPPRAGANAAASSLHPAQPHQCFHASCHTNSRQAKCNKRI